MGPDDIEQVGLFVTEAFPIPELARLQHGHLSLQQIRPYLRPEEWESFFKFAFVRNPFDRFVSYCAFMTRDAGRFRTRSARGDAPVPANSRRSSISCSSRSTCS